MNRGKSVGQLFRDGLKGTDIPTKPFRTFTPFRRTDKGEVLRKVQVEKKGFLLGEENALRLVRHENHLLSPPVYHGDGEERKEERT